MKKHNEGYTLVLVLVVLTVLCLLSSALLTMAVKNLQAQKAIQRQLQDKYTAQGEIEKIVGQLNLLIEGQAASAELAKESEGCTITCTGGQVGQKTVLSVAVQSGSVRIECELNLAEAVFAEDETGTKYTFTGLTGLEYTSYEIKTASTGGGE